MSAKYRPVFTDSQMRHLTSLCKKEMSSEDQSCLRILIPMLAKIDAGIAKPTYISGSPKDLSSDLGFGATKPVSIEPDIETLCSLFESHGIGPAGISLAQFDLVKKHLAKVESETKLENYETLTPEEREKADKDIFDFDFSAHIKP